LRNDIAHSLWVPAPSPNSIQPDWILRLPAGVRPLHGDYFVEHREDKMSYSLDDLGEAVQTLAENYARFSSYLREAGLAGG
jgi:hypothetical protein